MLILNKWIRSLSSPEELKRFKEMYDFVEISNFKARTPVKKTITMADAKMIAYSEYDGEIKQIFILEDGDAITIETSFGMDGNGFFNSDGFAFFTLYSNGKEKEYVLENSPYSFKENDEDVDEDVVAEGFDNIESLLKKNNINLTYHRNDVLFLREL